MAGGRAMREVLLETPHTGAIWLQPFALLIAAAISNSVYLCFSGITVEAAAWLRTTPGAIGAMPALGNFATGVGYPAAASAADRGGILTCFSIGMLCTVSGCGIRVLGGLAQNFYTLALGQFVSCLGNCFFNSLPSPLAVRHFPARHQGLASAIGQIGVDFGSFGGPLFGALFLSDPYNMVWLQLLASAAMLPLICVFAKGRGCCQRDAEEVGTERQPVDVGLVRRTLVFLKMPGMALLSFGSMLEITVLNTFPGAIEQIACAVPQLSVKSLSGAMVVSMLLGEIGTGLLILVCSVERLLWISSLLTSVGWLFCLLGWYEMAPPELIMVGWVFLALFGMGAMQVLSYLKAAETVPAYAGTASAMMHFASSATCVLAQLMTAVLLNSQDCQVQTVRRSMLGWSVTGWVGVAFIFSSLLVIPPATSTSVRTQ